MVDTVCKFYTLVARSLKNKQVDILISKNQEFQILYMPVADPEILKGG